MGKKSAGAATCGSCGQPIDKHSMKEIEVCVRAAYGVFLEQPLTQVQLIETINAQVKVLASGQLSADKRALWLRLEDGRELDFFTPEFGWRYLLENYQSKEKPNVADSEEILRNSEGD